MFVRLICGFVIVLLFIFAASITPGVELVIQAIKQAF